MTHFIKNIRSAARLTLITAIAIGSVHTANADDFFDEEYVAEQTSADVAPKIQAIHTLGVIQQECATAVADEIYAEPEHSEDSLVAAAADQTSNHSPASIVAKAAAQNILKGSSTFLLGFQVAAHAEDLSTTTASQAIGCVVNESGVQFTKGIQDGNPAEIVNGAYNTVVLAVTLGQAAKGVAAYAAADGLASNPSIRTIAQDILSAGGAAAARQQLSLAFAIPTVSKASVPAGVAASLNEMFQVSSNSATTAPSSPAQEASSSRRWYTDEQGRRHIVTERGEDFIADTPFQRRSIRSGAEALRGLSGAEGPAAQRFWQGALIASGAGVAWFVYEIATNETDPSASSDGENSYRKHMGGIRN